MQELIERERISPFMMHGWDDCQRSYKKMDLLFNETF